MVPAIIIPRKLFLLLASHSVIWTEIFPRCRRLAVDHKLLQSKRNIGWELEPADPVQTLPFLALPFKRMSSETCRNWSDPQKGLSAAGVSPPSLAPRSLVAAVNYENLSAPTPQLPLG